MSAAAAAFLRPDFRSVLDLVLLDNFAEEDMGDADEMTVKKNARQPDKNKITSPSFDLSCYLTFDRRRQPDKSKNTSPIICSFLLFDV